MSILTKDWVTEIMGDGRVGISLLDHTGKRKSAVLTCGPDEFDLGCRRFADGKGALVQDAFPFLSGDEREFLLTGMTPDEWDDLMGEDE